MDLIGVFSCASAPEIKKTMRSSRHIWMIWVSFLESGFYVATWKSITSAVDSWAIRQGTLVTLVRGRVVRRKTKPPFARLKTFVKTMKSGKAADRIHQHWKTSRTAVQQQSHCFLWSVPSFSSSLLHHFISLSAFVIIYSVALRVFVLWCWSGLECCMSYALTTMVRNSKEGRAGNYLVTWTF